MSTKWWGIVLIVIVLVLGWLFYSSCSSKEGFMPYRCGRTGMNYLDVYYQQDYYKEYPYGYPNPDSYTTAWYTLRNMYGPRRTI